MNDICNSTTKIEKCYTWDLQEYSSRYFIFSGIDPKLLSKADNIFSIPFRSLPPFRALRSHSVEQYKISRFRKALLLLR